MIETAHVIRDETPPDGKNDEREAEIIEGHVTMDEWGTGDAGENKCEQTKDDAAHMVAVPELLDAIPNRGSQEGDERQQCEQRTELNQHCGTSC